MNKILAAACAGGVLSVSLAACGAATSNTSASKPASPSVSSASAMASGATGLAASPASTLAPQCIAPSSVSHHNVYPHAPSMDYVTPAIMYTDSCQAFLDNEVVPNSGVEGDVGTMAMQAQGYCWQDTMTLAQYVDSSATTPDASLMQACRDGIAAAGGPAANSAPTSGSGQAASMGD